MNSKQVEYFRSNLLSVRKRIVESGGDIDRITIVAVTKRFPSAAIEAAMAAGVRAVGENFAQEAVAKAEALAEIGAHPAWHFIGQLQRNKVRQLAGFVDVWHTVDNERLAIEIAKRQPNARVFIQVNATEDPSRGGCDWVDIDDIAAACEDSGLVVQGLMGVGPHDEASTDMKATRLFFRRLVRESKGRGYSDVSCGMSNDFEIAVEEGATVLRLGTALFGSRPSR